MTTDKLETASSAANILRGLLQAAHTEAVDTNPLAAILLIDLIGQAAKIAQRLGEIADALEATS